MGGDGYYPEYYLRKRKRDRLFSGLTQILVAIVVMGGLGTLCGFLLYHYWWQPHHTPAGVTQQLAQTRQDIGTEQKIADAAQSREAQIPPAGGNMEYRPVDLSAVPYAESSFPVTSVALQPHDGQSGEPATKPAATKPETDDTENANSEAPGAGSGGTFEAPPPAPVAGVTPPLPITGNGAETAATSTADADTKAAEKKAADKKAADKKAADKKKADAAKALADKQAAAEKTAEKNVKDDKAEKPQPEKSVVAGKVVYRVYGGSAPSKEKAEALKQDLSKRGFAASIITQAGDSLLLVAVVDDLGKATALSDQLKKGGFGAFITKKTVK